MRSEKIQPFADLDKQKTSANVFQVSTGIWIGATPAFQQRVAQREHLATEIAFLEGASAARGERWCLGDSPLQFVGFFLVKKIALPETKPPETSKAGR